MYERRFWGSAKGHEVLDEEEDFPDTPPSPWRSDSDSDSPDIPPPKTYCPPRGRWALHGGILFSQLGLYTPYRPPLQEQGGEL